MRTTTTTFTTTTTDVYQPGSAVQGEGAAGREGGCAEVLEERPCSGEEHTRAPIDRTIEF